MGTRYIGKPGRLEVERKPHVEPIPAAAYHASRRLRARERYHQEIVEAMLDHCVQAHGGQPCNCRETALKQGT